jgi:hypothetical protein
MKVFASKPSFDLGWCVRREGRSTTSGSSWSKSWALNSWEFEPDDALVRNIYRGLHHTTDVWQPWYNWNIRVTFHIWVGSIFDPQGNPYEVDTFDGVMLPLSGMNRSGGFLYAWLTNQDGTDELVVVAHVNTVVAESCTTSLRTARWTVGLGDAAEDQDQFVNLFPALLDDPEVVNNDWTAVMQVHSDYYNVRTLPYTDENTWCFPVVLPQVAWSDLMNYVRTNSWAYQLPYVPTDVGWRVLLATHVGFSSIFDKLVARAGLAAFFATCKSIAAPQWYTSEMVQLLCSADATMRALNGQWFEKYAFGMEPPGLRAASQVTQAGSLAYRAAPWWPSLAQLQAAGLNQIWPNNGDKVQLVLKVTSRLPQGSQGFQVKVVKVPKVAL